MKILILLAVSLAYGQEYTPQSRTIIKGTYTVSTLPATPPVGTVEVGTLVLVTDGTAGSLCTTGGGTLTSWCRWNGRVWVPAGGVDSSATSAWTSNGTTVSTTQNVSVGSTVLPAGVPVNPQVYGADPLGVSSSTSSISTALATCKDVYLPPGYYLASGLAMSASCHGQTFKGAGRRNTYILKNANSDIVTMLGDYQTLSDMTLLGTFVPPGVNTIIGRSTWLSSEWPAGVSIPSFTDTTSGIIIGASNTAYPDHVSIRNIVSSVNGLDGVHWKDGQSLQLESVIRRKNGKWGFEGDQDTQFNSGTALETDDALFISGEDNFNGAGAFTTGGNMLLQGSGSVVLYEKSYGAFGYGFKGVTGNSRINLASEFGGPGFQRALNGSGLPNWITTTSYVLGDMVINAGSVYQATNAATSGVAAPTCTSGTCSDGSVIWQFRAGAAIVGTPISGGNGSVGSTLDVLFANSQDTISVDPSWGLLGQPWNNYNAALMSPISRVQSLYTTGSLTLGLTNLSSATLPRGLYEVTLYIVTTIAATGGTGCTATAGIRDGNGSRYTNTAAIDLTALGSAQAIVAPSQLQTGNDILFYANVTAGSCTGQQYGLFVSTKRLY